MIRLLAKVWANRRHRMLRRQWTRIRPSLEQQAHAKGRVLAALVYGETLRASKHPQVQFYGATSPVLYAPWGDGIEVAFDTIHSPDLNKQLRGTATWLVCVTLETAQATHPGLQALHQEVKPFMDRYRTLHERVLAIRNAS